MRLRLMAARRHIPVDDAPNCKNTESDDQDILDLATGEIPGSTFDVRLFRLRRGRTFPPRAPGRQTGTLCSAARVDAAQLLRRPGGSASSRALTNLPPRDCRFCAEA